MTSKGSGSELVRHVWRVLGLLKELWYSDDFQTRVCWWLVYTLAILVLLIRIAWTLYGKDISKTFMLQGGQNSPKRQRSKEGLSRKQHAKTD